MKRRIIAVVLIALGAVCLVAAAAGACITQTKPAHEKVTLCHRTSSETNPYVRITVNIRSVADAEHLGGHLKHEGDIVPPYTFGSFSFPGQGDQSLLPDCKEPSTTTTTVERTTTTTVEQPTTTTTVQEATTTTFNNDTTTSTTIEQQPTTTTTAPAGGVPSSSTSTTVVAKNGSSTTSTVVIGTAAKLASTGGQTEALLALAAILLAAGLGLALTRRGRQM